MAAIETLFAQLEGLKRSTGEGRLATSLVPGRLYVARSGEFRDLFIEGTLESFGQTLGARHFSWGEFRELDSGRTVPALVLKVKHGATGARLLSHVTYEVTVALERDPEITKQPTATGDRPLPITLARSGGSFDRGANGAHGGVVTASRTSEPSSIAGPGDVCGEGVRLLAWMAICKSRLLRLGHRR